MTAQDKDLLLRDLCGRLPYGVKFTLSGNNIYTMKGIDLIVTDEGDWEYAVTAKGITPIEIKYIKHYLRPMSSMTEEEKIELCTISYAPDEMKTIEEKLYVIKTNAKNAADFYNMYHFDYRGLIEKGLALEAPEDMYKTK